MSIVNFIITLVGFFDMTLLAMITLQTISNINATKEEHKHYYITLLEKPLKVFHINPKILCIIGMIIFLISGESLLLYGTIGLTYIASDTYFNNTPIYTYAIQLSASMIILVAMQISLHYSLKSLKKYKNTLTTSSFQEGS